MKHNGSSNKYYLYGCTTFRDDMLYLINDINLLCMSRKYSPYDVLKHYYLEEHIPNDQVELTWPLVIYTIIKHKTINIKSDKDAEMLDDCPF